MYNNYNLYVGPSQQQFDRTNYYQQYDTLNYQSFYQKPKYLDSVATQRNQGFQYKEEDNYYNGQYRERKETYYQYLDRSKKSLDLELQQMQDRISNLMTSRIEEQQEFTSFVLELNKYLQDIEQLKQKCQFISLDMFLKEFIDIYEIIHFLHQQSQTQIRKCDVELLFNGQSQISKTKLNTLLGNRQSQIDEQIEELEEINNFQVARILTMIIQCHILVEQKRQQYQKQSIRINDLFYWLDLDQDQLITEIDFTTRFRNCALAFKFLTQNSLDKIQFNLLFKPKSQAMYL